MSKPNITISQLEILKLLFDSPTGIGKWDGGVMRALVKRGLAEWVDSCMCPACCHRDLASNFKIADVDLSVVICPHCEANLTENHQEAGRITQAGRDLIATSYGELKRTLPDNRYK